MRRRARTAHMDVEAPRDAGTLAGRWAKRVRLPAGAQQQPQPCCADVNTAGDEPRASRKATASLTVVERLLMGLLTEKDLIERGIVLEPEQLALYRRIRGL